MPLIYVEEQHKVYGDYAEQSNNGKGDCQRAAAPLGVLGGGDSVAKRLSLHWSDGGDRTL